MTESTIVASQELLWGVILALVCIVCVLLMRVRALYRRVAPLGALVPSGTAITKLEESTRFSLTGEKVQVGGKSQLFLFVHGSCPVSGKMVPIVQDFARREKLSLLFFGDDTTEAQIEAAAKLGISQETFINDPEIGRSLGVDRVPFAVLLGDEGVVLARGLVNSREHLESLLGVQKTGYSSLQSYMNAHPSALAP